LLFYAIAKRQPRWFWLAFLYKTGIDSVAAYAQLNGIETVAKLWSVELIVGLFGAAGWWGTRRIQARYPAPRPVPGEEEPAPPSP
ncbi:MAG: hypothetical protein GYA17_19975, partial [Chloroflexi bacterium]|nr:hypothetical protein [Chloroflexota bacterium]